MKLKFQSLTKINNMNILIIDDHALVKKGIETRIKKVFPMAICHFVTNARLAIAKIHEVAIDLILCDLEFNNEPKIDGFFIIKNILDFEPKVKTIALTNYNSYRIMKKALASGFHSFLEKGCSYKEFSETLLYVVNNDSSYESPTMKRLMKKRNQFLGTIFSESLYGISDLSERERELTLLTSETTDRQILAKLMNVTPYTIDSYFKNILSKLNLKHRQELSLFSLEFKEDLLKYKQKK